MREFSSITELAEADVDKIASIPEIPRSEAEEIYRYFHREKQA